MNGVTAALLSFALAVFGTRALCSYALRRNLIDVPNERSSHTMPTPRGGGLAIVIATTLLLGLVSAFGAFDTRLLVACIGGGVAVAAVGFLDDHRQLSVGVRFTVHCAAALWALIWLDGLGPLRVGENTVDLGWAGYVLGVLGIVWVLNLFNFMDGIDGIAASEAAFIAVGGALLSLVVAAPGPVTTASLILAAACLGFLVWNWPPARIFMGDVGSGYLGYMVAILAIAAARENSVALFSWLALGGVFFADATVTLVRRLVRGERVYQAHRSHAYQRLALRWGSHRLVTIAVIIVNMIWLLPAAWLTTVLPNHAGWIAIGAVLPIAVVAYIAGAGLPEQGADRSGA